MSSVLMRSFFLRDNTDTSHTRLSDVMTSRLSCRSGKEDVDVVHDQQDVFSHMGGKETLTGSECVGHVMCVSAQCVFF